MILNLRTSLFAGWAGILLGFLSGCLLGLGFHREGWLGGYGSLRRRMYRLAHISLFALGALNLLFYFTFATAPASVALTLAAGGFLLGALTMPLCCVLVAHRIHWRLLFAVPVVSLVAGGVLALVSLTGTVAFIP